MDLHGFSRIYTDLRNLLDFYGFAGFKWIHNDLLDLRGFPLIYINLSGKLSQDLR